MRSLLPALTLVTVLVTLPAAASAAEFLPSEPIEIGTGPQFVFDRHLIDNYWAIKYKNQAVERAFHQPRKHEGNPVIAGDGGSCCVVRDQDGTFRMVYQTWQAGSDDAKSQYAIAYAESKDGLAWELPKLGLHDWKGTKQNNIVHYRKGRASSPFLVDVPPRDRRGYRHVMLYSATDGMRLIGSNDLIHWDAASDTHIRKLHSDTQNSLVYDPARDEYVMYCRAKHVYRTFQGAILDTGESRRVARMESKELWSPWTAEPQQILVPDELDEREHFNCFYGMTTAHYGGVFWGFLWCFKMNTDIHTDLAISRDGKHFERLPWRPKMIERGPDGAWDDGMVFGCQPWIEVGDQWRLYYSGWDGPHQVVGNGSRTPGIGLVTMRKEGFISMRGPSAGGALVTRKLLWPGGKLLVNADASQGELKVRVTDEHRKPLAGLNYDDCVPLTADRTAHAVAWKEATLDELRGKVIRLEFFLKSADLYTFRATGGK